MNHNISQQEIEDGKVMGGIAYLGLIGFIIAFVTSQDNRYVLYHCQQSLALMIASFIISAFSVVGAIPIIGWLIGIGLTLAGLGAFVLFIIGMINGFSGKIEPLPVIGEYAFKLNLMKNAHRSYRSSSNSQASQPQQPQHPQKSKQLSQETTERYRRSSDDDPYSYGDVFKKR
ncbi:MAG: DUF4870 domain-containing protein [Candidatus Zixiibacteriota bacterium]